MRFSQKGSEVEKSSVLYMKVSFKFELPGKHHPDTGLAKHSRFDTHHPKELPPIWAAL